jgi:hypothetical protein
MWACNQNWNSDSQSSLQSCPRPPDYTYRSIRVHIPVPTRNVRTHIPVCAIGVRARPSFPSALTFPLSPTGSAPDIPYAPLHPRPATRLRPLARRRGGPGGNQRGQGKSNLPWPSVNACLILIERAQRSIRDIGRAGGRPAPQTTMCVSCTHLLNVLSTTMKVSNMCCTIQLPILPSSFQS